MRDLCLFLCAAFRRWVPLVIGAPFAAISLWQWLSQHPKNPAPWVAPTIAVTCLFAACFLTWRKEHLAALEQAQNFQSAHLENLRLKREISNHETTFARILAERKSDVERAVADEKRRSRLELDELLDSSQHCASCQFSIPKRQLWRLPIVNGGHAVCGTCFFRMAHRVPVEGRDERAFKQSPLAE
jgi:hypothetical protein